MTGEVLTFTGWRDPNYEPAPGATPYPACWKDEFAVGRERRQPAPAASTDPNAEVVTITALGRRVRSDRGDRAGRYARSRSRSTTRTPAIPHDVQIKDAHGCRRLQDRRVPGRREARLLGAGAGGRGVPVRLLGAPEHDGDPDGAVIDRRPARPVDG